MVQPTSRNKDTVVPRKLLPMRYRGNVHSKTAPRKRLKRGMDCLRLETWLKNVSWSIVYALEVGIILSKKLCIMLMANLHDASKLAVDLLDKH